MYKLKIVLDYTLLRRKYKILQDKILIFKVIQRVINKLPTCRVQCFSESFCDSIGDKYLPYAGQTGKNS